MTARISKSNPPASGHRVLRRTRSLGGLLLLVGSVYLVPAHGTDAKVVQDADMDVGRNAAALEACDLTLTSSLASPQVVGTRIRWTATACDTTSVFRFSVSDDDGDTYRMVRDNSKRPWFDWAPLANTTARYHVRVERKASYALNEPVTEVSRTFEISPLPNLPTAVATSHPLVALYSNPPCKKRSSIFVQFSEDGTKWRETAALACDRSNARSFLVAGLKPQTTYQLRHVVRRRANGHDDQVSRVTSFTTGAVPASVARPAFAVMKPVDDITDVGQDVSWNAFTPSPAGANPLTVSLDGTSLWYWHPAADAPELSATQPVRLLAGGINAIFARDAEAPAAAQSVAPNVLRLVELDGSPRWETSLEAVSAQTNSGDNPFPFYGFHHDLVQLANGNIGTVGYTLRCLPSNTSGYTCPAGDKLWLGDAVVVIDREGHVVWKWNGLDHFSTERAGPLVLLCAGPLNIGCPILGATNYTHVNAVSTMLDPKRRGRRETQLMISLRHQSWLAKLDYASGQGDGSVIWRFGADGCWNGDTPCFTTSDPDNWPSASHDAHLLSDGSMVLFDNGNERCLGVDPHFCSRPSRGQHWNVDEGTLEAEPMLNFEFEDAIGLDGAPFKTFSAALGSAQRFDGGNYAFVGGFLKPATCGNPSCVAPFHSYVMEVGQRNGVPTQTYTYRWVSQTYRAYRLSGLYNGDGTDPCILRDGKRNSECIEP